MIHTYGDIGNMTAGYYSRQLLKHAVPVLILERFATRKTLPQRETKVIEFRRSKPFTAATTPLVEGKTPESSDFGYDSVSVQIQQYGDYAEITDVIQDTSKDSVLNDMSERQGEQIGETKEKLMWDVLLAGTSVWYGGSVASRAAVTTTSVLDANAQRRIVSGLHKQKAKHIKTVLGGSEDYETYAVEASYCAITHTDALPTIRDLKANDNSYFVPTSRYGTGMGTTGPHEKGAFEEVRYICSPDHDGFRGAGAAQSGDTHYKTSGKTDVYAALYLGRDSFGAIVLRGKNAVMPMVLNPGVPRAGDPLGQRGSVGWKMWHACVVLNDAWQSRFEFAVKK